MKNNDFSKIIILILLNSFVWTQEIKQIVNNPMPNHQLPEIQSIDFPEIQSIDFPEIQSIDSPPIQIQKSYTKIRLSKVNKVIEQTRDTASNIKIPVPNMEKVAKKVNKEFSIPKPQIPNKARTIVDNSIFDGFNLGITADVGFASGAVISIPPLGFSLTIGTPYGFDLGPFDFSISAIFGRYSGSYDSAVDDNYEPYWSESDSGYSYEGKFVDEFNPVLFGIGGNITLAKIIFTEGHIGNLGSGTGIHGFTGLSLERIMKKRKLPFHNILIGSELFISSDMSGAGNSSGWIGMALRAVYEF